MKVLIVHEVIPEQTQVCVYEMSEELYKKLSLAHGYAVNNEENPRKDAEEAVLAIGNGFCTDPEYSDCCESELGRELFMKLKDVNGTDEIRDLTGVERMIHCAFML